MRLNCYYNFQPEKGVELPDIEDLIKRDWTNPYNYIGKFRWCNIHGIADMKIGRLELYISNREPIKVLDIYNQRFVIDSEELTPGELSPIHAVLHCYYTFHLDSKCTEKDGNLHKPVPGCIRDHWGRPAGNIGKGEHFEVDGIADVGFGTLDLHIGTHPLVNAKERYANAFCITIDNRIKTKR